MTDTTEDSTQASDSLTRPLLYASLLLLLAALFVRHHLVPAKHRLGRVVQERQTVEAELDALREENERLLAERTAMQVDPVYQERLLRRLFRFTASPGEFIVKEHP